MLDKIWTILPTEKYEEIMWDMMFHIEDDNELATLYDSLSNDNPFKKTLWDYLILRFSESNKQLLKFEWDFKQYLKDKLTDEEKIQRQELWVIIREIKESMKKILN